MMVYCAIIIVTKQTKDKIITIRWRQDKCYMVIVVLVEQSRALKGR